MPYEKIMSERQANEKVADMEPDCWFRLRRNGNSLEILISRNGNEWTPRTTLDLADDFVDFMIPVFLPLQEYQPSEECLHFREEYLHFRKRCRQLVPSIDIKFDEEDIS